MFWVDEMAEEIDKNYDKKQLIVRDEKTLSGRVHVGSVRGVAIHAVIAQALRERGRDAKFIYEFNDMDPMDGLPVYLDEAQWGKYMGMQLKDVPSPEPSSNAKNFPEFFGNEFAEVIDSMGFQVEYSSASERYAEGMYDKWIEKVANHPEDIRRIYQEVSGSEKPEDWNPLQVVCDNCQKIGTVKVVGFDGKEAKYKCVPDMVTWAKGCGHEGKKDPYKGNGKIPWKVEWAVKWAGYDVDVEGSGKDHCAAGGSHDVSAAICEQVLGTHVPYNIPYEFLLIGGAKMSSSKGEGASARAVARLIPPELLRFLMLYKDVNQPIDFNPEGQTIPRLFDRYDEYAEHYFERVEKEKLIPDFARAFYYSQLDPKNIKDVYRPRFSRLVFLVQMPHLNVEEEVTKEKGSALTDDDKAELEKRLSYVRLWLEEYADEQFKFEVQKEMPELAYDLSDSQEQFLTEIADALTSQDFATGEDLHGKLHEIRKASPLKPRDAFAAIYMALIGKDSGPQAGWFLESLEKDFVVSRFKEAVALPEKEKAVYEPVVGELLTIHKEVVERLPGVKSAMAIIEGIKVEKENPELEELKKEILGSIDAMDLKKNSPYLAEYKAMSKTYGVDPTKRKPSPAALIDRLANGKDLYKINTLVDAYNLMVIKHQMSFGAFNLDPMQMPIHLRYCEKGEIFTDLADGKDKPLDAGELVYADSNGLVIARDYNFRDSHHTIVTESTTRFLLQTDGNSEHTKEQVQAALDEAIELVLKFCGGKVVKQEFVAAS